MVLPRLEGTVARSPWAPAVTVARMTRMQPEKRAANDGDVRRIAFSATKVGKAIRCLSDPRLSASETRRRWLEAVAARTIIDRPDLAESLRGVLGVEPAAQSPLSGLTIGEVGVCYEALLAMMSRKNRKASGQYFTPDDAARFMARQAEGFGVGTWLDPCCGVGNLSWHLAEVQDDPGSFIRDRLVLIDADATALRTAVALLSADWADEGDEEAVQALSGRSQSRDFLSEGSLPAHDYAILNPPYARTAARPAFETSNARDLFALFLERIAKTSRGFIAVTPASYLSVGKFKELRMVLNREYDGGRVFVFDNVPDTLFRGYKFGSNNTSRTNFVRAAITVCAPRFAEWQVTPIIRWAAGHREVMFDSCPQLLVPRRVGPHGEWVKVAPGLQAVWDLLASMPTTVADLVVARQTPWSLDLGLTPRYYISAVRRSLTRTSKVTLYFAKESDRDRVAAVLNSSIPYLWWRALDGGVTLPRRVLMSTPVPDVRPPDGLLRSLWDSERRNLVVKLNAGRHNENVKHPAELIQALDELFFPAGTDFTALYSSNMFADRL